MTRACLALPLLLLAGTMSAAAAATYVVDPRVSHVVIHVAKSGLLSFAGHTHDVEGPVAEGSIVTDPDDLSRATVRIVFETAALTVSGKGEPPNDVPEVQRTMESDRVLDVERFPRITFVSRQVRVISKAGGHARVAVTGDLTLHGVTRAETIEVVADFAAGTVTATGKCSLKQTDYGMHPVTAAGGTVRVKDQLDLEFSLVGRAAPDAGRYRAVR